MMKQRLSKIFVFTLVVLVGLAPAVLAKNISVKNKSNSTNFTLSDLAVYPEKNQGGTPQVILIGNDNSDDQAMAPGQTRLFNTDKDNNPIGEWMSFEISYTDGTGEHEGIPVDCLIGKSGMGPVIADGVEHSEITLFTGAGIPMYIGYSAGAPLLPEGQTLNLVNGVDASFPEFSFSSTPFTVDLACNAVGFTGINGSVSAGVTIEVTGYPTTPATAPWGIVLLAATMMIVAGGVLFARRRTAV